MSHIKELLSKLRTKYAATPFTEDQLMSQTNPLTQFNDWFRTALKCDQITEANAACLSTSTPEGRPSSRMLLIKNVDERGFSFFTNYESRKGQELKKNPQASLLFFWPVLHRQVRVEGNVYKMTEEESTEYFQSRPFSSQVSASVSAQSHEISSRHELEKMHNELEAKSLDKKILPKPIEWGGFILNPIVYEFWQGQSNRLHDRLVYTKQVDNTWTLKRLAP